MRRLLAFAIALAPLGGCAHQMSDGPSAPLVLMGESELTCNIDRAHNGVQKLVLKKGSGLAFDAQVSPIVDGTVRLKGPTQGGTYAFTSHLAAPAKGSLSGVGEVEIESLETKVSVTVNSYDQPAGPGTVFTFRAGEIAESGAYVEFSGTARSTTGQRFAFRVNLGQVKDGNGKVTPAGAGYNDRMMAKAVYVAAPAVTTLVESKAMVRPIP
jgi:hypothetical protein